MICSCGGAGKKNGDDDGNFFWVCTLCERRWGTAKYEKVKKRRRWRKKKKK